MSSPVFSSMNNTKAQSPRSGHGRHPSNTMLGGIGGIAGSPFGTSSITSPTPIGMTNQLSGNGFTPSTVGMARSPSNLGGLRFGGTGMGMGGSNAGSPLGNVGLIGSGGVGIGLGSLNNAGVPSPSVFANMAASVGVHDPLVIDENNVVSAINENTLQISSNTPNASGLISSQNPITSSTSTTNSKPSDLAVAAMHTMDPFNALIYNVEQFSNTQLNQLEILSDRFFDLYENVLLPSSSSVDIQMKDVIEAHSNLINFIDQLLTTAGQAGFSGLSCPSPSSPKTNANDSSNIKTEEITMTNVEDQDQTDIKEQPTESKGINDLIQRLTAQSKDSFERRERLRESSSMITNILAHST